MLKLTYWFDLTNYLYVSSKIQFHIFVNNFINHDFSFHSLKDCDHLTEKTMQIELKNLEANCMVANMNVMEEFQQWHSLPFFNSPVL